MCNIAHLRTGCITARGRSRTPLHCNLLVPGRPSLWQRVVLHSRLSHSTSNNSRGATVGNMESQFGCLVDKARCVCVCSAARVHGPDDNGNVHGVCSVKPASGTRYGGVACITCPSAHLEQAGTTPCLSPSAFSFLLAWKREGTHRSDLTRTSLCHPALHVPSVKTHCDRTRQCAKEKRGAAQTRDAPGSRYSQRRASRGWRRSSFPY